MCASHGNETINQDQKVYEIWYVFGTWHEGERSHANFVTANKREKLYVTGDTLVMTLKNSRLCMNNRGRDLAIYENSSDEGVLNDTFDKDSGSIEDLLSTKESNLIAFEAWQGKSIYTKTGDVYIPYKKKADTKLIQNYVKKPISDPDPKVTSVQPFTMVENYIKKPSVGPQIQESTNKDNGIAQDYVYVIQIPETSGSTIQDKSIGEDYVDVREPSLKAPSFTEDYVHVKKRTTEAQTVSHKQKISLDDTVEETKGENNTTHEGKEIFVLSVFMLGVGSLFYFFYRTPKRLMVK